MTVSLTPLWLNSSAFFDNMTGILDPDLTKPPLRSSLAQMHDIAPTEKHDIPSPVLPHEILVHIGRVCAGSRLGATLSSLARTNRALNRDLTPVLYNIIRLHSTKSFGTFFSYFNFDALCPRERSKKKKPSNLSFGHRHQYLKGLMRHMEVQWTVGKMVKREESTLPFVLTMHQEESSWWQQYEIDVFQQCFMWDSPDENEIISNGVIRLETLEINCIAPCACEADKDFWWRPEGEDLDRLHLLFRATFPKYVNQSATIRGPDPDDEECEREEDRNGYWAVCHNLKTLREHRASLQGSILPPEKTRTTIMDFEALRTSCVHFGKNDHSNPQSFARALDRELIIIVDPCSDDKTVKEEFASLILALRLRQQRGQIRLIVTKTVPYSCPEEWRAWVKEKGDWINTYPGAWEDWALEKRKKLSPMLNKVFYGGKLKMKDGVLAVRQQVSRVNGRETWLTRDQALNQRYRQGDVVGIEQSGVQTGKMNRRVRKSVKSRMELLISRLCDPRHEHMTSYMVKRRPSGRTGLGLPLCFLLSLLRPHLRFPSLTLTFLFAPPSARHPPRPRGGGGSAGTNSSPLDLMA